MCEIFVSLPYLGNFWKLFLMIYNSFWTFADDNLWHFFFFFYDFWRLLKVGMQRSKLLPCDLRHYSNNFIILTLSTHLPNYIKWKFNSVFQYITDYWTSSLEMGCQAWEIICPYVCQISMFGFAGIYWLIILCVMLLSWQVFILEAFTQWFNFYNRYTLAIPWHGCNPRHWNLHCIPAGFLWRC